MNNGARLRTGKTIHSVTRSDATLLRPGGLRNSPRDRQVLLVPLTNGDTEAYVAMSVPLQHQGLNWPRSRGCPHVPIVGPKSIYFKKKKKRVFFPCGRKTGLSPLGQARAGRGPMTCSCHSAGKGCPTPSTPLPLLPLPVPLQFVGSSQTPATGTPRAQVPHQQERRCSTGRR